MIDREELIGAIRAASDEYDADLYLYTGSIDEGGWGMLAEGVTRHQKRDKAILIMATNGGVANAAFQIARFLQDQYEEWTLFCPGKCKSAGTLIALGANRLIMDVYSELGPLDVQLFKQNEIALRKSGLLSKSSFDALADAQFELYERLMLNITVRSRGNVNFKMASELSACIASKALAPIYKQMNPDTIGSEHRDLNVATQYGERLALAGGNSHENTVAQLVNSYPSHDFVIDRIEAQELFKKVDYPSENLYRVVGALGACAYNEAPSTAVFALGGLLVEEDEDVEHSGDDGRASTEPAVEDRGREDSPGDPEPGRGGDGSAPSNENTSDEGTSSTGPGDDQVVRPLRAGQGPAAA